MRGTRLRIARTLLRPFVWLLGSVFFIFLLPAWVFEFGTGGTDDGYITWFRREFRRFK